MQQGALAKEDFSSIPGGSAEVIERLQNARGFVFDMDGTLVLSDKSCALFRPLPGGVELTRRLAERGIPFVVFTNGTALPPKKYARSLRESGISVPPQALITPATCAADLFLRRGYRRVMFFGVEGVSEPLREAGLEVVPPSGKVKVDAVFCGWHPGVSMEALQAGCHAIWEGASLFSASMTKFFATADGITLAPSRVTAVMIREVTGCRVTTTGKPSLDALRCAARRLGVKVKDIAVVGDDPELEIAMAVRGGCLAVAVRTGLGESESLAASPQAPKPHLTVRDCAELLQLWEGS